ncbi:MAG TPA: 50S ribosomal protein L31 [Candidatus Sulfomarinibacteraceae bacterium]|nr:50S ribosomal protein L31 [Candidatus Sulfomarinibacteraceae bacterium]
MKKDIHPEWYPEAEVVVNGEVVMRVGSTKPRLNVEIWSGTHPFYTGQQRLVDTEGQVERFLKRLQRREELLSEQEEEEEEASPLVLPIEEIGLPTRSQNALKEAGLETVGDVYERLQEGEDALLAVYGVGQRALITIRKYLRAEGLIE